MLSIKEQQSKCACIVIELLFFFFFFFFFTFCTETQYQYPCIFSINYPMHYCKNEFTMNAVLGMGDGFRIVVQL